MKRLWILTNIETTVTSDLLLDLIKKRGWEAQRVSPQSLSLCFGSGRVVLGSSEPLPDIAYTRLGSLSPFESIATVRALEVAGVPVVNSSGSLILAKDKVCLAHYLSQNGIPVPHTLFLPIESSLDDVKELLPPGPPWIVKLTRGTKGKGVMVVSSHASLRSVVDTLHALESPVVVQEFIPSVPASDIRVIVIGGEALGAIRRVASGDEFRSNMHLGGGLEHVHLNPELASVAVRAAAAVGLFIAGVDVMESANGYVILEVNSSPGLNAFASSGQHRVVEGVVDRLIEFYNSSSKSVSTPQGI